MVEMIVVDATSFAMELCPDQFSSLYKACSDSEMTSAGAKSFAMQSV